MSIKRWQDWATLVAGVWFAASPWVLGYGASGDIVLYNALGVGFALVFFSAGALARPETWEEVVNFVIAAWAIASPWVLGYSTERNLANNAVVVGLIVAALAAWTALDRSELLDRWSKHGTA